MRTAAARWRSRGAAGRVTYDNYDITKHNAGQQRHADPVRRRHVPVRHARAGYAVVAGRAPAGAGYSSQVEHGYYDYVDTDNNPATANSTLRFTLITDTNPTAVFPSAFGTVSIPGQFGRGSQRHCWPECHAGPGGHHYTGGGRRHRRLERGAEQCRQDLIHLRPGVSPAQSLSRITGTFGTSPKLDWTLTEPQSVNNEFTGSWISRDHRRFWVWDYLTNYGMHVGVVGGAPSVNDACFTTPDVRLSYGIYTRRGSNTGCYPFDRPLPAHSSRPASCSRSILPDQHHPVEQCVRGCGGPEYFNWRRRGQQSPHTPVRNRRGARPCLDSSVVSPAATLRRMAARHSPTLFLIGPAASFAAKVANTFFGDTGQEASVYFDDLATAGTFTDWCQGDILGIRTTLNGSPINYPVYLCRNRA